MADDGWQGMSHQEIVSKLSGLGVESARAEADRWTSVYGAVSESVDTAMKVRSKLLDSESWSGEAANSAYDAVDRTYKKIAAPDTGLAAESGKLSQAAEQDGETLIAAGRVPQNYPVPDKNATKDEKQQALNAIRAAAQSAYTDPMSANRPQVTDPDVQQLGSTPNDSGGGGNGGGGNGGGGSGSGTQTPSATDGLASKDTKPQLAGGEGQQAGAGQGQGQGAGQGGGSGGGQGSGSGGSGSGSGLGSGLGSGSGGSGLPLGSTTAAGFSPSSTGTGGGGSGTALSGPGGLSALRGGGLPGGAVSGSGAGGVNPAAVGAAGVRGGPMGMMGGAGGHGRGGKGEDDDDHATPQILINYDNTDEFMGDMPSASPGVIGDWSEQEKAEKAAREREVRRYKALGWDVKFE
ncbi:hypothetical protein P3F83_08860 [Mycobacteroides immunogenum]|uniref:hypothetical protein n=1 Tax=Mycobacteroides immunogenum TaxID=83262 RepID=UPI0025B7A6D5|nr:hypothetical protein [Mycobacteroides immunogenum]WJR35452.1 hypothetical protein P3F83_08860 [Mycobacteroides immunogenum]